METITNWNIPQNVIEIQRDFLVKIIESCEGMKALIFDDVTLRAISLVYMQSEGFTKDVYLVENIKFLGQEKVSSMIAIFILTPSNESIQKLKTLLADPIYKEYHISKIDDDVIRMLAEADEYDVVKRLQEIFLAYQALTPEMCVAGLPTTISLHKKRVDWREQEELIMNRMSDALSGLVLNLRQKPDIRYLGTSAAAERLATSLDRTINKEVRTDKGSFDNSRTTVIITERSEDPATPLVFDWSYLAMIHECLGMDDNRVKAHGKDYNMFIEEDDFLKNNLYSNYGEVASNLKEFLQQMSEKKKHHLKIEGFEDMQKALNSMPEIKKESSNASKHVDITGDISRQINLRKLLAIGELEQTMLSKDNKNDSFKQVMSFLEDNGTKPFDVLRLVLLFCIKYEGDSKCEALRQRLSAKIGPEGHEKMKLFDNIFKFSSVDKRSNKLFNLSFTEKMKGRVKQTFENVQNVYILYRPYLETLFEDAYRGRLKESDYKCTDPHANLKERYENVIIFFIGGVTYIESRVVNNLREKYPGVGIFLSGSHVLNSKKFLAEILNIDDLNQAAKQFSPLDI